MGHFSSDQVNLFFISHRRPEKKRKYTHVHESTLTCHRLFFQFLIFGTQVKMSAHGYFI